MRLVKPSFEILGSTPDMHRLIARAGRTCYKSDDNDSAAAVEAFIRARIAQGHESVIEHGAITVRLVIDRGVSHELVRHRLASYSQESTRYCDYRDHVEFVIPPWVRAEPGEYDEDDMHTVARELSIPEYEWMQAMFGAEQAYLVMRQHGWTPQQARSVLPCSLRTEVVATTNPREWRHVFSLRCHEAAHPQMREVMRPLLAEFASRWPALFDDLLGPVDGAAEIAAERRRQAAEGWDDGHDDKCTLGELARGAVCYARVAVDQVTRSDLCDESPDRVADEEREMPSSWPWDREWWKPHGVVRNLARAGALIAAEIDRLRRRGVQ